MKFISIFLIVFVSTFHFSLPVQISNTRDARSVKQYPAMGRSMRSEFFFKDDFILFDHGAYGTYPKAVQKALHEYQERAEANPDLWIRREANVEVDRIRGEVAKVVNADTDDVVMIPNTTSGMNAIFRSLVLGAKDRILHFSTIYGSMGSLIQYIVDYSGGNVTKVVFNVNYPSTNDKIVQDFTEFLENNDDPSQPIRIALIDHISSSPAVILPLERIIPLMKAKGIRVLVDGAHAIGQIPVDIKALQPDYYITNCHKWMFAARGCALMYVHKDHQGEVHPAHINSGYTQPGDYLNEFFWTGTMDYSPYMTVTAALQFRRDIGGEEAIRKYTHNLAMEGGAYLAERYGTEVLQTEEQMGSMVDVRLPVNNPNDPAINGEWWIDTQLYKFPHIYVSVYKHNGAWYGRHSVQIYNDMSDFKVAGDVFMQICNDINNLSNGNNNAQSSNPSFLAAMSTAFVSAAYH